MFNSLRNENQTNKKLDWLVIKGQEQTFPFTLEQEYLTVFCISQSEH